MFIANLYDPGSLIVCDNKLLEHIWTWVQLRTRIWIRNAISTWNVLFEAHQSIDLWVFTFWGHRIGCFVTEKSCVTVDMCCLCLLLTQANSRATNNFIIWRQ